jgi:hypothetical protein
MVTVYATREGTESQAPDHISHQYKTAKGAPIIQDARLHADFDFLADTEATDRVLQGTYEYPPDMDRSTKLMTKKGITSFPACQRRR